MENLHKLRKNGFTHKTAAQRKKALCEAQCLYRNQRNQHKVDPQIMAEWTGLEPATPGVTGRY
ncbi:MAG: hypothetical protein RR720_09500, partial [Comamonas sp.]|uniref:hypothetical protein n=1 Tax=Comamonas sp. TaxID=34028 RepID=UPI002FCBFDB4